MDFIYLIIYLVMFKFSACMWVFIYLFFFFFTIFFGCYLAAIILVTVGQEIRKGEVGATSVLSFPTAYKKTEHKAVRHGLFAIISKRRRNTRLNQISDGQPFGSSQSPCQARH